MKSDLTNEDIVLGAIYQLTDCLSRKELIELKETIEELLEDENTTAKNN